jgi:catechol 2,3-dioxygenase-like lactoylglutathione lyase family enzyme
MISPTAIDHTCLVVTSLRRAKAYYETLFDFDIRPRDGDPITLVVESPAVHFFLTESPDAPAEFLRKQHISFRVADLDAVIAQLRALGIAGATNGRVTFFAHGNYRWCEWRDPDGIRLECVEPL